MAFVFGTAAQSGTDAGNPKVFSFPASIVGTQTLFVLGIAGMTTGTRAGGSPTLGGTALTKIGNTKIGTNECTTELWYLSSPPTVASTVSIPNSGSLVLRAIGSSYVGSGGGVVEGSSETQGGPVSTNPRLTITTTHDGCVLVDILSHGDTGAMATNNGTLLYKNDNGVWNSAAQYFLQAGAGALVASYRPNGQDDYGYNFASFFESASGPDNKSASLVKQLVSFITNVLSISKGSLKSPSLSSILVSVTTGVLSASKVSTKTAQLTTVNILVNAGALGASSGAIDTKSTSLTKAFTTVLVNSVSCSKNVNKSASLTSQLISVSTNTLVSSAYKSKSSSLTKQFINIIANSPSVSKTVIKTASTTTTYIKVTTGSSTITAVKTKTATATQVVIKVLTNTLTAQIPGGASGISLVILLRSGYEAKIPLSSRISKTILNSSQIEKTFVNKSRIDRVLLEESGIEKTMTAKSKI